jgi:hypothetical protein
MADDLFQQLDPTDVIEIDHTKDYLPELVGEGKKYKDNETLAKAAVHKDAFIEQLKRENAETRRALSERINMEQFLDKIEAARKTTPSEPGTPLVEQDGSKSAVTSEDIEALLERRETDRARKANLVAVEDKLKGTLGPDYKRRVQEKALALKVDTTWLTDVAARNPDAFYELMGLNQTTEQSGYTPPPRSSVTAPSVSNQKNYAYYNKMRQEKGEGWYFSVPVQQERWKALQELGEDAFYKK